MFKKKTITESYTVEKCDSCGKEETRKFRRGDCLFDSTTKCSCDGYFFIEKIYGIEVKQ